MKKLSKRVLRWKKLIISNLFEQKSIKKNITDLAIRINLNKLLTNIMKNSLDCKFIKHST